MDGADNGGMGRANIKVEEKAHVGAIISMDNSADGSSNITNQHTSFAGLAFTVLAAVNCADNFNLAIPEKTPLDTGIFTFNEFFAIFAVLANTTLER